MSAPSRWGRCSCGAAAEVLFQQPRCTRTSCRWYDPGVADEMAVAALDGQDRAWWEERVRLRVQ